MSRKQLNQHLSLFLHTGPSLKHISICTNNAFKVIDSLGNLHIRNRNFIDCVAALYAKSNHSKSPNNAASGVFVDTFTIYLAAVSDRQNNSTLFQTDIYN